MQYWSKKPHNFLPPIQFLFFLFTALEDGCPIHTVGHDEGVKMDSR